MTISTDDVRQLWHADTSAVLVLLEGRARVLSADEMHSEENLGALQIISRAELVKQTNGAQPSDREVSEQAAALDSAVSGLGG